MGPGSSASAAASLITDCVHAYGPNTIAAAVAAGGSWTFSCGDTGQAYSVTFGAGDPELKVTKPVSITAGPYTVLLEGQNRPGRLFNVTAGSLTLRRGTGFLILVGGHVSGALGQNGLAGVDGASGQNGTSTSPDATSGSPGTAASPATPGGPAANAKGGCILVGPGTTVTLSGVDIRVCSATGGRGGNGAAGGDGGSGGRGWDGAYGAPPGSNGVGADGADGSAGSNGGEGLGGGIYNAGTLVVAGGSFTGNTAQGGKGGSGGHGGSGGNGGGMHNIYEYGGHAGQDGGAGGDAGQAGNGGVAEGGAIYSVGQLSVSGVTFNSNSVNGGDAGASATNLAAEGGFGGEGGGGEAAYVDHCPGGEIHPSGPSGNGGDGGNGSNGGNGGNASGAAIFSSTTTIVVNGSTFGTGSQADVAQAGRVDPNGPGPAGGGGGPGFIYRQNVDCDGNDLQNSVGTAGADGRPGSPGRNGHATLGDVDRPVKLSGSVRAISCGPRTCHRAGMAGVRVLVIGRSNDGRQVSQVGTTDADGVWSVRVPGGKYDVGPTYDGKRIKGDAFDPRNTEVVADSDHSGIDFAACAGPSAGGQARDVGASVAATAPVVPTTCRSIYTVTVSARIPRMADPSPKAEYRLEEGNGYHHPASNPWFAVNREFPACFSREKVRTYTLEHDRAEWFTYIRGGELSSVKVSFAWDRHTQEVHVVSGPQITVATMTRVFVFRLYIHGHVQKGTCEQTVHEPLLVFPVGGADAAHGELPETDFSLILAWAFPFDPAGVRIDPSTFSARAVGGVVKAWHFVLSLTSAYDRLVEGIVEEVGKLTGAEKLAEKLWPPARVTGRLALEFGASELLGTGALKAITKAPALVKRVIDTERYLPTLIRAIEKGAHVAHTVGHVVHKYNTKREKIETLIKEIVEVTASFSPEGEYPVMGAVIRGRFATTAHHDYGAGNRLPDDSTLALSARTTELPSIKLTVTRSALPSADKQRTVTTGTLPWHSSSSATLNVFNLLSEHQSNELTEPFAAHHERGIEAVEEIHHATSQLPELNEAVRRSEEEVTQFTAEDREAARPGCSSIGEPEHGSFLCYVFKDARP